MARNIELKVVCNSEQFAEIGSLLNTRELSSRTELVQTDTYFQVPNGRLKLREIQSDEGQSAELIQYDRADDVGSRFSTYQLLAFDPARARELTRMLQRSTGVLTIVRKHRTVAIWSSTRIHLDQVESLGSFVELETVLDDGELDQNQARAEHEDVIEWLGLSLLESIAGSYSDLLLLKGQTA